MASTRKKPEASDAYLNSLEQDLTLAKENQERAKWALYSVTATAKLFDPEFENARKACLESTSAIDKIEAEIKRVRKELGK